MSRSFGCEFEFSSPWDEVEAAVKKAIPPRRLTTEQSHHSSVNNKRWDLKTDCTTSAELATPVSTLKNLPEICKIAQKLRDSGIKVSRADAFHVHVATGKANVKALVALWARCEDALFCIVPKYRRGSTYCERIAGKISLSECISLAESHHASFSISSHDETGVEFRIWEGTLDPKAIGAWVRFCLKFVAYVAKEDPVDIVVEYPSKVSLSEICDKIGLAGEDRDFLEERKGQKFPNARRSRGGGSGSQAPARPYQEYSGPEYPFPHGAGFEPDWRNSMS